ncbi:MAG: hypothetical protein KAS94_00795 [Desulfobulbaceae bacterium]|nr:hypothetical protein [Desulfobulbaceae bacterium]
MKKIMLCFAAGCLGAVANSLVVWFFGTTGMTGATGVAIAPALSLNWLYPRIVWGGLWGLLFLLPLHKTNIFTKGAIISLGPTIIQLFVIFPLKANKGLAGLELGLLTPLFVLFFNWVWGVTTAASLKLSK